MRLSDTGFRALQAGLAIQRFPWEQGTLGQAAFEAGQEPLWLAMAFDCVLRKAEDGRLSVVAGNHAVTDPASGGEIVLRAAERTGEAYYADAAKGMYDYLKTKAPRTDDGVLWHNEISFNKDFSPAQLWVDAAYMAPPFLAAMGDLDDAAAQLRGLWRYLQDEKTGLLSHIYDVGQGRFLRKALWATGNGWALLGAIRVAAFAQAEGKTALAAELRQMGLELMKAMLPYLREDGRYHDVLDDPASFVDGSSAMMQAAFIYRGIKEGWLDEKYRAVADTTYATLCRMQGPEGLFREVCGCPNFDHSGVSCEAQAAFVMMEAWK